MFSFGKRNSKTLKKSDREKSRERDRDRDRERDRDRDRARSERLAGPSLTESAIRSVAREYDGGNEDGGEAGRQYADGRSKVSSRSERSEGRSKVSSRREMGRDQDRERQRDNEQDRYREKDNDRNRDKGKGKTRRSRSRSGSRDGRRADDKDRAREQDSSRRKDKDRVIQPRDATRSMTDIRPTSDRTRATPEGQSSSRSYNPSAPQNQFPGQDPNDYAHNAFSRFGTTVAEGGYGLAAAYYGDQGQSVSMQPGVAPPRPEVILDAHPPHLQPANATPSPAADTGDGAAADFYGTNSSAAQSYTTAATAATSAAPASGGAGVYYAHPSQQQQQHSGHTGIAALGAAGLAAGVYASQHNSHSTASAVHNSTTYEQTSTYTTTTQAPTSGHTHNHRRSAMDRIFDLVQNKEDVRRMEEYTEYIGVCRYCFDPRSSAHDAPRRHHYHRRRSSDSFRRRSQESLRASVRKEGKISKASRYRSSSSSDSDSRRRSKSGWIGAGLAAYGLSKVGGALWKGRNDFDDTYSVKSGRSDRPPSYAAEKARMETGKTKAHSHRKPSKSTQDGLTRRASQSSSDAIRVKKPATPQPAKKLRKRRDGRSASSSSSDTTRRSDRKSRKPSPSRPKRRDSKDNLQATLLGIGATAAALAAAQGGRKASHVVAVKQPRVRDSRKASTRGLELSRPEGREEDEWESASDSEGSSLASALAFGASDDEVQSGSGGRGWGWGWRRPSSPIKGEAVAEPIQLVSNDGSSDPVVQDVRPLTARRDSPSRNGISDPAKTRLSGSIPASAVLAGGVAAVAAGAIAAKRKASGARGEGVRFDVRGDEERRVRSGKYDDRVDAGYGEHDVQADAGLSHSRCDDRAGTGLSKTGRDESSDSSEPRGRERVSRFDQATAHATNAITSHRPVPSDSGYGYSMSGALPASSSEDVRSQTESDRRLVKARQEVAELEAQVARKQREMDERAAHEATIAAAIAGPVVAAGLSHIDTSTPGTTDFIDFRPSKYDSDSEYSLPVSAASSAERSRSRSRSHTRPRSRSDVQREDVAISDAADRVLADLRDKYSTAQPSQAEFFAPGVLKEVSPTTEEEARKAAIKAWVPDADNQVIYALRADEYRRLGAQRRIEGSGLTDTPSVGLIKPTPTASMAGSVRGNKSPLSTASRVGDDADVDDIGKTPQVLPSTIGVQAVKIESPRDRVEDDSAPGKVSWGPHETRVYEVVTPLATPGEIPMSTAKDRPETVQKPVSIPGSFPTGPAAATQDPTAFVEVHVDQPGEEHTERYRLAGLPSSSGPFAAETSTTFPTTPAGASPKSAHDIIEEIARSNANIHDFAETQSVPASATSRVSAPSQSSTAFYQSPYFETVSDFGSALGAHVPTAQVQRHGFVEEEEVEGPTPVDEVLPRGFEYRTGNTELISGSTSARAEQGVVEGKVSSKIDDEEPSHSRREQKKRDKLAEKQSGEKDELKEQAFSEPAPPAQPREGYFPELATERESFTEWEPPLSKKEQKKRDKLARKQRDEVDDVEDRVPSSTGPAPSRHEPIPKVAEQETFTDREPPLSKKEQKKRDKLARKQEDERGDSGQSAMPTREIAALAEDMAAQQPSKQEKFTDWEPPLSKKEQKKRDKLARKQTDEAGETPTANVAPEPKRRTRDDLDVDVAADWEPSLSKKEQKRRDKLTLHDTHDFKDEAEEKSAVVDDWAPPLTKKEQKKRDKLARSNTDDLVKSDQQEDDVWEPPLSAKERKKREKLARQSTFDMAVEQPLPEDAKSGGSRRDIVEPEQAATDDLVWEAPLSSKERKKLKKDKRKSLADVESDTEALDGHSSMTQADTSAKSSRGFGDVATALVAGGTGAVAAQAFIDDRSKRQESPEDVEQSKNSERAEVEEHVKSPLLAEPFTPSAQAPESIGKPIIRSAASSPVREAMASMLGESSQSPRLETPRRPSILPIRSSTSTSVPIRFRRPPATGSAGSSPAASHARNDSIGSPTPLSPETFSPLAAPRNRASRPRSIEIRREFQPLYLVEHNRKLSEAQSTQDEQLPPLPPSAEGSRSSSLHSSFIEYESAVEDQPEQIRTSVMDDPMSSPVRRLSDEEGRHFGSNQSTPRASHFPSDAFGRRGRAEPEFYSWEDVLREEKRREDDARVTPKMSAVQEQPGSLLEASDQSRPATGQERVLKNDEISDELVSIQRVIRDERTSEVAGPDLDPTNSSMRASEPVQNVIPESLREADPQDEWAIAPSKSSKKSKKGKKAKGTKFDIWSDMPTEDSSLAVEKAEVGTPSSAVGPEAVRSAQNARSSSIVDEHLQTLNDAQATNLDLSGPETLKQTAATNLSPAEDIAVVPEPTPLDEPAELETWATPPTKAERKKAKKKGKKLDLFEDEPETGLNEVAATDELPALLQHDGITRATDLVDNTMSSERPPFALGAVPPPERHARADQVEDSSASIVQRPADASSRFDVPPGAESAGPPGGQRAVVDSAKPKSKGSNAWGLIASAIGGAAVATGIGAEMKQHDRPDDTKTAKDTTPLLAQGTPIEADKIVEEDVLDDDRDKEAIDAGTPTHRAISDSQALHQDEPSEIVVGESIEPDESVSAAKPSSSKTSKSKTSSKDKDRSKSSSKRSSSPTGGIISWVLGGSSSKSNSAKKDKKSSSKKKRYSKKELDPHSDSDDEPSVVESDGQGSAQVECDAGKDEPALRSAKESGDVGSETVLDDKVGAGSSNAMAETQPVINPAEDKTKFVSHQDSAPLWGADELAHDESARLAGQDPGSVASNVKAERERVEDKANIDQEISLRPHEVHVSNVDPATPTALRDRSGPLWGPEDLAHDESARLTGEMSSPDAREQTRSGEALVSAELGSDGKAGAVAPPTQYDQSLPSDIPPTARTGHSEPAYTESAEASGNRYDNLWAQNDLVKDESARLIGTRESEPSTARSDIDDVPKDAETQPDHARSSSRGLHDAPRESATAPFELPLVQTLPVQTAVPRDSIEAGEDEWQFPVKIKKGKKGKKTVHPVSAALESQSAETSIEETEGNALQQAADVLEPSPVAFDETARADENALATVDGAGGWPMSEDKRDNHNKAIETATLDHPDHETIATSVPAVELKHEDTRGTASIDAVETELPPQEALIHDKQGHGIPAESFEEWPTFIPVKKSKKNKKNKKAFSLDDFNTEGESAPGSEAPIEQVPTSTGPKNLENPHEQPSSGDNELPTGTIDNTTLAEASEEWPAYNSGKKAKKGKKATKKVFSLGDVNGDQAEIAVTAPLADETTDPSPEDAATSRVRAPSSEREPHAAVKDETTTADAIDEWPATISTKKGKKNKKGSKKVFSLEDLPVESTDNDHLTKPAVPAETSRAAGQEIAPFSSAPLEMGSHTQAQDEPTPVATDEWTIPMSSKKSKKSKKSGKKVFSLADIDDIETPATIEDEPTTSFYGARPDPVLPEVYRTSETTKAVDDTSKIAVEPKSVIPKSDQTQATGRTLSFVGGESLAQGPQTADTAEEDQDPDVDQEDAFVPAKLSKKGRRKAKKSRLNDIPLTLEAVTDEPKDSRPEAVISSDWGAIVMSDDKEDIDLKREQSRSDAQADLLHEPGPSQERDLETADPTKQHSDVKFAGSTAPEHSQELSKLSPRDSPSLEARQQAELIPSTAEMEDEVIHDDPDQETAPRAKSDTETSGQAPRSFGDWSIDPLLDSHSETPDEMWARMKAKKPKKKSKKGASVATPVAVENGMAADQVPKASTELLFNLGVPALQDAGIVAATANSASNDAKTSVQEVEDASKEAQIAQPPADVHLDKSSDLRTPVSVAQKDEGVQTDKELAADPIAISDRVSHLIESPDPALSRDTLEPGSQRLESPDVLAIAPDDRPTQLERLIDDSEHVQSLPRTGTVVPPEAASARGEPAEDLISAPPTNVRDNALSLSRPLSKFDWAEEMEASEARDAEENPVEAAASATREQQERPEIARKLSKKERRKAKKGRAFDWDEPEETTQMKSRTPEQDVDFQATLAAGLAASGFDSNLASDSGTSPSNPIAHAEPHDSRYNETTENPVTHIDDMEVLDKNKHEERAVVSAKPELSTFPARSVGENAASKPREDHEFDAIVTAGLGAAGFAGAAALLSRSDDEKDKVTDDAPAFSMPRKQRKKDKKKGEVLDQSIGEPELEPAALMDDTAVPETELAPGNKANDPSKHPPISHASVEEPVNLAPKNEDDEWAIPSRKKKGKKSKGQGKSKTSDVNEKPADRFESPAILEAKAVNKGKKKKGVAFDWTEDVPKEPSLDVSAQIAGKQAEPVLKDDPMSRLAHPSGQIGFLHTSEVSQHLPTPLASRAVKSPEQVLAPINEQQEADAKSAPTTWSFDALDDFHDGGMTVDPEMTSRSVAPEQTRDSGYDTIGAESKRNSSQLERMAQNEQVSVDTHEDARSVASWEDWTKEGSRAVSLVESTTKERTSHLFQSPPAEAPLLPDVHRSPVVTPSEYRPIDSPELKRGKANSDVGRSFEDIKSARTTSTPLQSFRERMNTTSRPREIAIDPPVPAIQTHLQALRSPSGMSNTSANSLQRLRSPEALQHQRVPSITASIISNESNGPAPSLRRVNRSVSANLRSEAARRGSSTSSDLQPQLRQQQQINTNPPFRAPPTPPLNVEDDMSEHEGVGADRSSVTSPTRPHSAERQQLLHIGDLQAKLQALAAENDRLRDAGAGAVVGGGIVAGSFALRERDAEISKIRGMLATLQDEVSRLEGVNKNLGDANRNLVADTNDRYATLQEENSYAHQELQRSSRELEKLRHEHSRLTNGMESIVREHIDAALEDKDTEIERLRAELDRASTQIRELQARVQSTAKDDFLVTRDEDYFDNAAQKLCKDIQTWVLRFSKSSDNRACRLTSDLADEKLETRLDNCMLDGSDVDPLLVDRVRRRDVFVALVTSMIWEYVFTRYLFGMDREQRQKLKTLEKILLEVGPARAVAQWRATTLTLLSRRPAFVTQRDLDHTAVTSEIYSTLTALLPPPKSEGAKLSAGLRKVLASAIELAIDMRTQRADYFMIPPPLPEYDAHGDLVSKTSFDQNTMNERSGDYASNAEVAGTGAPVKLVLFPLVMKRGDDLGEGGDETVICPAQVLVAANKYNKRIVGRESGVMDVDDERGMSRRSLVSGAGTGYM